MSTRHQRLSQRCGASGSAGASKEPDGDGSNTGGDGSSNHEADNEANGDSSTGRVGYSHWRVASGSPIAWWLGERLGGGGSSSSGVGGGDGSRSSGSGSGASRNADLLAWLDAGVGAAAQAGLKVRWHAPLSTS